MNVARAMSWCLRHHPLESTLADGWTPLSDLCLALEADEAEVRAIVQSSVRSNGEKRFELASWEEIAAHNVWVRAAHNRSFPSGPEEIAAPSMASADEGFDVEGEKTWVKEELGPSEGEEEEGDDVPSESEGGGEEGGEEEEDLGEEECGPSEGEEEEGGGDGEEEQEEIAAPSSASTQHPGSLNCLGNPLRPTAQLCPIFGMI